MADFQVVNPYNFVPFSKEAPVRYAPEKDYQDETSLLHGYLDVHLTNTTPLIIPEGKPYLEDKQIQHKYYHFFRLPDEKRTPAIPGSELRGLLRSVYETITNSCTTVVLDHNDYSMRTSPQGSFKQIGLLEYNPAAKTWSLYSTMVSRIPLNADAYWAELERTSFRYKGIYKNGQEVFFSGPANHATLVEKTDPKGRRGWLLFNRPVVAPRGNKSYSIRVVEKGIQLLKSWAADDKSNPYKILDEVLSDKNAKSSQNRSRPMPAHDDYKAALNNIREKGGCLPVWYLPVKRGNETLYYLSNASIGRVHIMRTWEEIMGSHSPCSQSDELCPACRLFGKTTDDGGLKGKIQITDALLQGEFSADDFAARTLDILSNPRPSAFDFYIRKPDGNGIQYWNYDYYGVRSYEGLKYLDRMEASPRGRKFYWHGKVKETDADKTKLNSTMEFLKNGHRFAFRIYFDGITERQLTELKYAVTLGENRDDSSLQLKIGHARPLGYGSVKLVIDKEVRRSFRMENQKIYSELIENDLPDTVKLPENLDVTALSALKAICNKKKTENEVVAYPTWEGKNGPTVYDWFSYNRKVNGGNWKTLPEPTDTTIAVPSAQGKPLTDASWNNGSGQRNSNSYPRPSAGYNRTQTVNRPIAASAPAPVSRWEVLPNTVIDNAVIDKIVGTAYIYVSFGKTNDPNEPRSLKGKMRWKPQDKAKCRVGSRVKIKVLRYHEDEKIYDVSFW